MTRILVVAAIVWLEILRRKDVYVLLILLGALLAILVSLDIMGLSGSTGYMKDVGLLAAWVFAWILAVHAGARELPEEETRGTIFPLLAKPVARAEVIFGKWLGVWTSTCLATTAFYVLVVLIVLLKHGYFDWSVLLQALVLHWSALGIMVGLSILLSTRLNRDAAASLAYILTAASFLVVPRIPEFAAMEKGGRAGGLILLYNIMPHFELFDLRMRVVHGYEPVGAVIFGTVLLYGAAMTLAMVGLAVLSYRLKRFSRSELM